MKLALFGGKYHIVHDIAKAIHVDFLCKYCRTRAMLRILLYRDRDIFAVDGRICNTLCYPNTCLPLVSGILESDTLTYIAGVRYKNSGSNLGSGYALKYTIQSHCCRRKFILRDN